jgi:putative methyltransferase (TIGR04325 family)
MRNRTSALLSRLASDFRQTFKKSSWHGDFSSWQSALANATGYGQDQILQKVKAATLKVKHHEAKYERDSVLFENIQYSWPLLAALMWVAAKRNGSLKVADFGGSLGSTYFQNKLFLDDIKHLSWNVIEQPNFVACGIQSFQDARLQFFETLEDSISASGNPDILVLSCVLPYLQDPYGFLRDCLRRSIPHIIVDCTYFNFEDRDRICVQTVRPEIYEASYPCWLLHYGRVVKLLETNYNISAEHHNDLFIYIDGQRIIYKGLLATMKT